MEENKITWDTPCKSAQNIIGYFATTNAKIIHDNSFGDSDVHRFELGAALTSVMMPQSQVTYYDLYRVIIECPPLNLTTLRLAISTFLDENGKYLINNVPLPSQTKIAKDFEEFLTRVI